MKVRDALNILNGMFPPEQAESYDNVGLLCGHPDVPVERILCALDLTEGLIDEAQEKGAQLIVTHHPILFHARKNLREDDPEGRLLAKLVRSRLSLIAAHTNYDNAPDGVNDQLAAALGLVNVQALANGLRVGELPREMNVRELTEHVGKSLCAVVRPYCTCDTAVRRVAVCGGAGSEFYPLALAAGAQAYVTGEVHHHDALAAVAENLAVLEAGHYETEQIAIKSLANRLQSAANALQYKVTVMESAERPFARPY